MSDQKNSNKFGEYLRSLRKNEKGLSLRDFSDLTGISFSHLSKIERGEYTPSRTTISIMADKLNLEKDKLLLLAGYAPDNQQPIITYQLNDSVTPNFDSYGNQMQILHQIKNDSKTSKLFIEWQKMNDEQREEVLSMLEYIFYKDKNKRD